jgi:uncharacterized protein (TIGR02118 family)
MIKVSVMYPQRAGAKFDMGYYRTRHVALLRERLEPALESLSIDEGIGGGEPDAPPPFVVIAHLHFDSLQSFQEAFAPNASEIAGDVGNYTDIEPVIQVSEIRL